MLGVTPRERELEDRESDLNDEEFAELGQSAPRSFAATLAQNCRAASGNPRRKARREEALADKPNLVLNLTPSLSPRRVCRPRAGSILHADSIRGSLFHA
jgi:hypothetical protein